MLCGDRVENRKKCFVAVGLRIGKMLCGRRVENRKNALWGQGNKLQTLKNDKILYHCGLMKSSIKSL